MTGLERTLAFVADKSVDRPPVHPILMRWAARHAGVKYRDFILDPAAKTSAAIRSAKDFDLDWVTVLSDPWTEASAFGIQLDYPEDNLPVDIGGHFPDAESAARLEPYRPLEHKRCLNRIEEIRIFRKHVGDSHFIVGWVEGPVAEYADLRGVSEAAMDFLDDPDSCRRAMDVIVESALEFITLQVEAGAHCIGIGDAFCSQIGPRLYRELAWPGEKRMIDHIHSLGALAKLHICGNTAPILRDMIATGADIVDIDHLVPDMSVFAGDLAPHQVFCGKSDPVSILRNGPPERIMESVRAHHAEGRARVIVSAGCELPPDTPDANLRALGEAAKSLGDLSPP